MLKHSKSYGFLSLRAFRTFIASWDLKEIGYLPQELGLYPNLSVRESLEYVGIMSGLKKKEYEERIDYYLDMTGLTAQQRKKNKQLSGGMKRRVGLVQALLHNPGILIVDEPTTGLDPEERIRIRNNYGSRRFGRFAQMDD